MADEVAGLIGAGRMGQAMIGHMAKGGFRVVAQDVSGQARDAAAALGAEVVETPAEAARAADIVFIAVGFDAEAAEVCRGADGIFAAARPGTLVVLNSTVSPDLARALGREAEEHGLRLLDVPIARGRHAAQAGTLLALVGGAEADLERARPMLECFCSDISHQGEVGHGQVAKAVNNLLLWVNGVALSEAAALAEGEGMDLPRLREALLMSSGKSWALENWDSVFFTWALEDMQGVLAMADRTRASYPLLGQIREQVKWAKANKEAGNARWTKG